MPLNQILIRYPWQQKRLNQILIRFHWLQKPLNQIMLRLHCHPTPLNVCVIIDRRNQKNLKQILIRYLC